VTQDAFGGEWRYNRHRILPFSKGYNDGKKGEQPGGIGSAWVVKDGKTCYEKCTWRGFVGAILFSPKLSTHSLKRSGQLKKGVEKVWKERLRWVW